MIKKLYIALMLILWQLPSSGQNDTAAMHPISPAWYQSTTFKTITVPVVFMGYGLSVSGNHGFPFSSYEVQGYAVNTFPGFRSHADDFLAFSPAALALCLKLSGVTSTHNLTDGFFIYALSALLTEGVVEGLKFATHEQRPDHSNYQSFPSAHTAFAFSGAEFVHQEYIQQSPWISIGGYTLATATGAMRIMNNKHWMSDVVFGAGIGILTTKVIYMVYPAIKKHWLKRHHPVK